MEDNRDIREVYVKSYDSPESSSKSSSGNIWTILKLIFLAIFIVLAIVLGKGFFSNIIQVVKDLLGIPKALAKMGQDIIDGCKDTVFSGKCLLIVPLIGFGIYLLGLIINGFVAYKTANKSIETAAIETGKTQLDVVNDALKELDIKSDEDLENLAKKNGATDEQAKDPKFQKDLLKKLITKKAAQQAKEAVDKQSINPEQRDAAIKDIENNENEDNEQIDEESELDQEDQEDSDRIVDNIVPEE
jgi:hypothetical protein